MAVILLDRRSKGPRKTRPLDVPVLLFLLVISFLIVTFWQSLWIVGLLGESLRASLVPYPWVRTWQVVIAGILATRPGLIAGTLAAMFAIRWTGLLLWPRWRSESYPYWRLEAALMVVSVILAGLTAATALNITSLFVCVNLVLEP